MLDTTERAPPTDTAIREPFRILSRRIARRVTFGRCVDALGATALPVFGIAGLVLLLSRIAGDGSIPIFGASHGAAALFLIVVWAVASVLWALARHPNETAALALWDERCGDHEMFVSAYCFAGDDSVGAGGELHVERARAHLAEARGSLARYLPLRVRHASWVAPLLLLAFAFSPLFAAAPPAPEPDAGAQAALVAEALDQEAAGLDTLDEGLSEEEKEKIEELKEKLAQSAEKMKAPEEKTTRDVVKELEQRAREAEKLAEALGAKNETIGSAMLAELERHADTARLAEGLRAQDLEKAAEEAGKLGRFLRGDELPQEAQQRVESAFQSGLEVATTQDLKTLLGQHMARAQGQLEKDRPKPAGSEFETLERRYRDMLRRMNTQEMLKRLAKNLRASGQRALGGKQRAVQKLKATQLAKVSPVGAQPVPISMGGPATGSNNQAAAGTSPPSGAPAAGSPVPGGSSQGRSGARRGGSKSGSQGARGQPSAKAPVPGSCPGCGGGT